MDERSDALMRRMEKEFQVTIRIVEEPKDGRFPRTFFVGAIKAGDYVAADVEQDLFAALKSLYLRLFERLV
jgi:hypothetical protein